MAPYAETKEQLGGIQILEARDLNHAVQLISQLPGFEYGLGPVEIRPVVDLSEIIKERAAATKGYLAMKAAARKSDQHHGLGAGHQHRFPSAEGGGTVG